MSCALRKKTPERFWDSLLFRGVPAPRVRAVRRFRAVCALFWQVPQKNGTPFFCMDGKKAAVIFAPVTAEEKREKKRG